jgi:hypothetical protein
MRSKLLLFVAVAGTVFATASPSAGQRETRERGIIVGVATSGSGDAPVTDMKVPDFTVRENDVAREVIRAAPAPPPSHVYLLIDDSQATQGLAAFLRPAMTATISKLAAMDPAPQLALMTFGERPNRRVDFTPNPEQLLKVANGLFPVTGSGAYFLQAITDVTKELKKREAASPVIFAFVSEAGPEFSSELHRQVADALRGAGASLWVVTLQLGAVPMGSSAARERASVLGDVTRDSGGMNKVVLSAQGIEQAFSTVTALITSRYLVTYGRPDSMVPPEKIEVTSRRKDVRILASKWAGR